MSEINNFDQQKKQKIKKLDESVINKIAAGEIIIQPANALKEMLENSIDAKATNIEIVVKEGGLKLLQITDNGQGIDKSDLHLLCERFATSKLTKFEDLELIATYGFRGEALSSISHISRLSVVSKTRDSNLAYKAYYINGKMCASNFKPATGNNKIEPKPIAGRDGTQITVEDLFYNLPSRFKGLKSKSDEFAKILDIVGRYAIHTGHVGFSCKKYGDPLHQLNTRANLSIKERVRIVYGSNIANELLEFDFEPTEEEDGGNMAYKVPDLGILRVKGTLTNANFNNKKKIQPVIFINHRLVSCDPLRRAMNSVFQFFLPKGSLPFFYISLEIKPENLDVNVHPTKREVRFLNEDEIIDLVVARVHKILSSVDTSRKFKTQTIVTRRNNELEEEKLSFGDGSQSESNSQGASQGASQNASQNASQYTNLGFVQTQEAPPLKKYRQENKMVRVDASQSKINPFLSQRDTNRSFSEFIKDEFDYKDETTTLVDQEDTDLFVKDFDEGLTDTQRINQESQLANNSQQLLNSQRTQVEVNLESIKGLKSDLTEFIDKQLTNVFNHAVFVGIIDPLKRLCCFQYDVKLFICDYAAVLLEFYYQISLHEFCNYGEIEFDEPLSLDDLLEPLYTMEGMENVLLAKEKVIETIINMKDMFQEYFRIIIDDENRLVAIPMIMKKIQPDFKKLPFFIYRLGTKINYDNEKECLQGILRQIALLYLPEPFSDEENNEAREKRDVLEQELENILFPELKKQFLATRNLTRDVVQIADLPGLYRVFERC